MDVPFPFEPYDVQRQLMQTLLQRLDHGGIQILESPTGTGRFSDRGEGALPNEAIAW